MKLLGTAVLEGICLQLPETQEQQTLGKLLDTIWALSSPRICWMSGGRGRAGHGTSLASLRIFVPLLSTEEVTIPQQPACPGGEQRWAKISDGHQSRGCPQDPAPCPQGSAVASTLHFTCATTKPDSLMLS